MPVTVMQILWGFVLPGVLVVLLGVGVSRFAKSAWWLLGVGVAVGFGIAYWNLEPRVEWPPGGNVVHFLFYLPILLGVLAWVDGMVKPPMWVRAVLLAILWRVGVRLFLAREVPGTLSATSAETWVDFSTLIALVWWLAFERMAETWMGVTVPVLLAAISAASAVVLAMGWHIQSSGALAGAITAMCCGGIVLGAFSSRVSFARGFAPMVALILLLLLMHGYFYTDDELTGRQELLAGLLLASPLGAFLGMVPWVRGRGRVWEIGARVAVVLVVLGVICAVTVRDYIRAEETAAHQDE